MLTLLAFHWNNSAIRLALRSSLQTVTDAQTLQTTITLCLRAFVFEAQLRHTCYDILNSYTPCGFSESGKWHSNP